MNANELADVLLSTKFQVDEDGTMIGVSHQAVNEAATMLRQQQAEIEALKHQVTGLKLSWQCETDIVEKQQALIEEQDKKIIELAFRAVYAERSVEVVQELSNENQTTL